MTYRLLKSLAKKLSRRELNARLKDFIEALPDGATVLNVGSGGEIMAQIEAAGNFARIRVTSTDIDPGRSPDIVDDLTRSQLPSAAFDAVVCAEVLEHVTDPPAAVGHLHRVLKDGGQLFLSTPYLFPTHDAPHDHFRYTEFGLRGLLADFEITALDCKTTWWETVVLLCWRQMWLRDRAAKFAVWLLTVLLSPILLFMATLPKGRRDPAFTAGFVLSARKPS